MDIKIYKDFNQDLKQIWEKFEIYAEKNVFQVYEWVYSWYKIIGCPLKKISLNVVVISKDNETLAIFPLGVEKKYGLNVLSFLGGINSDYKDPLVKKKF